MLSWWKRIKKIKGDVYRIATNNGTFVVAPKANFTLCLIDEEGYHGKRRNIIYEEFLVTSNHSNQCDRLHLNRPEPTFDKDYENQVIISSFIIFQTPWCLISCFLTYQGSLTFKYYKIAISSYMYIQLNCYNSI